MKHLFLSSPAMVADAVKATRAELGWTQAELAAHAKVGRRFVVDLEAGHSRAELGKVLSVLDALGIHAMAVPPPPPPRTATVADLGRALRDHG